jgi:alpha-beta hydrolase superfamily lysophospholipase
MSPTVIAEPVATQNDNAFPAEAQIPRFIQAGDERVFRFESELPRHKGEVLFIHGLTDHPGRHFSTAQGLAKRGFGVTLFDLAGHGGRQEPLERSESVYRSYALSDNAPLISWTIGAPTPSDFFPAQYSKLETTSIGHHQGQVDYMLSQVIPQLAGTPDVPLFLMGFSMGGLLAADAAIRWSQKAPGLSPRVKGVVLLSPAFRPQGRPTNRVENLVIDAAWSERNYPISPIRFVLKNALQINVKLDTAWGAEYMSDQPEEIELYRRDPLIPKAIPSAYASSIESLMSIVNRKATEFPVDSLFLFPSKDGITSVQGGLAFARRVESASREQECRIVQYYGNESHDLTRSSVRDQVRRTLVDWLESKAIS